MTLGEISNYCCKTTGDISSDAIAFAKDAIRLKYQTLYDAHAWRESMRIVGPILLDPALGGIFFLPYDAEEVIFVSMSYDSTNWQRLEYRERDWVERHSPNQLTMPGYSPMYYRGENTAWPSLNPGVFTFTSADRNGVTVYIAGADSSNYPISETFNIQGITHPDNSVTPTSISTVHSYAVVTTLSKTDSDVPLTIQASLGTPVIISPTLNQLIFTQLRLVPPPILKDQNNNPLNVWVRCQVKLKPDTLDNDMSVPRISHIWDALIEFTLSALYTKYRQLGKADSREQKALLHIQAAVNVEKAQSEFRQQVVPIIYEQGDYLQERVRVTSYRPFG